MEKSSTLREIIRDIAKAKYILRIGGYRPEGTKSNPIKFTAKKI